MVLDSSSLSNSDSMVAMDSSSLSSSSGSTVVSGNSSSAGSEVGTTTNFPGSSSSNNMRGLVGLEALDVGGISRNLLHHPERRWGKYISVSGVVPSGTRTLFWGRVVLVAHRATCPDSVRLPACTLMLSPPGRPPCTGELTALVCRDRAFGYCSRVDSSCKVVAANNTGPRAVWVVENNTGPGAV